MYNSNTVLVVGAGASHEIGMPVGETLKEEIQTLLTINYNDDANPVTGSPHIAAAIKNNPEIMDYSACLAISERIAKALPQATSIDNFVDNQENKDLTTIAKLAITEAILGAENCSMLYPQKQFLGNDDIRWNDLNQTWFSEFFRTLTENLKISQLEALFNNLTFIIFNYDRAIEYFLVRAIENYYGVQAKLAQAIVKTATFLHPYGTVGKLDWQIGSKPNVPFGHLSKTRLYEISLGIKTFTEQIEDRDSIKQIRDCVDNAKQIIFLGFAFLDANMDLLQPERTKNTGRVIATALGISDNDCEVIKTRIERLCRKTEMLHYGVSTLVLDNQATCYNLFKQNQRLIRA